MNIFSEIKNSIYGPKYYKEVLEKPFSYSFKYYVIFALLFALVFTTVATIRFIPIVNLLSEKVPQLAGYFPQELAINIKNGKASTNVQEPYFVKMPQSFKADSNARPNISDMKYLFVIDTKDKFDLDVFNSYKTYALLTADSIIYIDGNKKITISSFASVKDFTLNRDKVAGFINTIRPLFATLYPIVFAGAYIFGFMSVLV